MKFKYGYILIICLLLCGCQNINNKSIAEITGRIKEPIEAVNVYRTGYSYYLPSGMNVKEYSLYNDVIESSDNLFYLYVDMVSYFNKVESVYIKNSSAWYSQDLNFDNKFGYLEINLQKNDQYLIEIMFNYAKIEVMVDEDDINLALTYAVSILRSIEYNDNVIKSMLSDDNISYREEVYDIFNTNKNDGNLLERPEEEIEVEESEVIKDTDLIN